VQQNVEQDSLIVEKYANLVYKLAYSRLRRKEDTEDVFQEVFLKYINKQPKFENEQHEKYWFIRVTINCTNTFWRRRKLEVKLQNKLISNQKTSTISSLEDTELNEYLKNIPSKYSYVIHLYYYEDLTVKEISKLLKKKEASIRMQLTRGRRLLKSLYEEAKINEVK
jgi:RNA polymerase sigma-70 factor (ECF subfamily)